MEYLASQNVKITTDWKRAFSSPSGADVTVGAKPIGPSSWPRLEAHEKTVHNSDYPKKQVKWHAKREDVCPRHC
jgi:hypothetical protein